MPVTVNIRTGERTRWEVPQGMTFEEAAAQVVASRKAKAEPQKVTATVTVRDGRIDAPKPPTGYPAHWFPEILKAARRRGLKRVKR